MRAPAGESQLAYDSIDKLQNVLASEVFSHTKDKKKASGRALGTLVEIVTFYTLCSWGLRDSVAIERPAPEFGNHEINHNVEFSLHPIVESNVVDVEPARLPLTSAKISKSHSSVLPHTDLRKTELLSSRMVMRNSAVVSEWNGGFTTAHIEGVNGDRYSVALTRLLYAPFAVFECKRVGVEEGMKKGPQTIEKAKQGAYVARAMSSLQKFRLKNGEVHGVLDLGEGVVLTGRYEELFAKAVNGSDASLLEDFVLTVGVVSNHGNWFTAENQNKELRVLAGSYDWLLFLTDEGLSQFIDKLLLNPEKDLVPARNAFLSSYESGKKENKFTKVRIELAADMALKEYFESHESEIESWFNVISPAPPAGGIQVLRTELDRLRDKPWSRIRGFRKGHG